jgi:hypothetical protein
MRGSTFDKVEVPMRRGESSMCPTMVEFIQVQKVFEHHLSESLGLGDA